MRNLLKTFSASSVKANDIIWGRWCLPAFNKNCNQDLKSHWANIDNSLSSTKPEHNTPTQNEEKIVPWDHPTLLVFYDSFGY